MGDLLSEPPSEVPTELHSQSVIDARMQSFREERESMLEVASAANSAVHLDSLVVPQDRDIRILMRPLTRRSVSPSLPNCEWIQLTAEIAEPNQPEHKVLAVTQTERDINFTVDIPGETSENHPPLGCELFYDPASDNQIFRNRSDFPLMLSKVPQQPTFSPGVVYAVNPKTTKKLEPGTWRIKVLNTNVLDFRIVAKRPAVRRVSVAESSSSSSSSTSFYSSLNASGKRNLIAEDSASGPGKRFRPDHPVTRTEEDGVVMFMRPETAADPLVFPLPTEKRGREIMSTNGNPLIDMADGTTVEIPGGEVYTIKKVDLIASTRLSAVARAEFSKVPDSIITVKVLKTSLTQAARPQDEEKALIQQSQTWLREFVNHEQLNHKSIPRLFGGDGRYLSLYMEHIEAKDLSTPGHWQNAQTTMFTGNRVDAERILRDIAGALDYLHARNIVHNDIKPGNIMYTRERGAVLCDFGMSFRKTDNQSNIGGTPYYIGPEYIGRKLRGTPGDVWALGVTMLYVLGKIGFPDARANRRHPRQLYWFIRDLNESVQAQAQQPYYDGKTAAQKMRSWLAEINEVTKRLNRKDMVERLVMGMLELKPQDRLTTREVVDSMAKLSSRTDG